mgnify:FL=1
MQKLLPRVHGSRRKLEETLKTLGSLCFQDDQDINEVFKNWYEFEYENLDKVKYPLSLEKIARMYNDLTTNGFTSFAEA